MAGSRTAQAEISSPSSPTSVRQLRAAFGAYPTGVVIATACDERGDPLGMTMNSFTSVSLDPPLLAFSIDRRAASLPAWRHTRGYALHVLAREQQAWSDRFARALTEKWSGIEYVRGLHAAPLLEGSLARFECTAEQQLEGGDHVIFLGRIERFAAAEDGTPLVFHRGRYTSLVGASEPASPVIWPLSIHY